MESKAFRTEWQLLQFVAEITHKSIDNLMIYQGRNPSAEILDQDYEPVTASYNGKEVKFNIEQGDIGYWLDLIPV